MTELRLAELNRIFLVGRLTKDPEVRQTTNGTPVANFTIAVNRRYKNAAGEWKDETTFVGIVAWQKLAELCKQYLAKGRAVLVEGKLQSRSWETEDGQKRSLLEVRADRVEFLDRGDSRPAAEPAAGAPAEAPEPAGPTPGPQVDDDLPF
ncbi:MAG: single-stranded DNA-binding protein [Candidatus Edwardsbacteria bacterium]|jgi:single-strand DNA-binding protein|nr:single-stranded DNA-binding protein [Candidatus Edwardsbacteria bacterium]